MCLLCVRPTPVSEDSCLAGVLRTYSSSTRQEYSEGSGWTVTPTCVFREARKPLKLWYLIWLPRAPIFWMPHPKTANFFLYANIWTMLRSDRKCITPQNIHLNNNHTKSLQGCLNNFAMKVLKYVSHSLSFPHALEDFFLHSSINAFSKRWKMFIHNIYNWEKSGITGEFGRGRAHRKGCDMLLPHHCSNIETRGNGAC